MYKPYTLFEIYQMVKDSCLSAGVPSEYVTVDSFLFYARRIFKEFSDRDGLLRFQYEITGDQLDDDNAIEVAGIKNVITAYIGEYEGDVVTWEIFSEAIQLESVSGNHFMVCVDEVNEKLYFENVEEGDTVVLTLKTRYDDIDANSMKTSCPDIDYYILFLGVCYRMKKAHNLAYRDDMRDYREALADEIYNRKKHTTGNVQTYYGFLK